MKGFVRVHLQIHDAIESLESVVVEKIPKNFPHRLVTRTVISCFRSFALPVGTSQIMNVLTLQKSQPEPSIAVILGRLEDLTKNLPSQDDAKLVVEIAHTSLATDR
jgi:hypothetical protein